MRLLRGTSELICSIRVYFMVSLKPVTAEDKVQFWEISCEIYIVNNWLRYRVFSQYFCFRVSI